MSEACPTCGQPVRVVSTDEGTSHYEAAAGYGAQVAALLAACERAGRLVAHWNRSGYRSIAADLEAALGNYADTASAAAGYGPLEPWRKALATALSTACRCQSPVDGPHKAGCPLNQFGYAPARALLSEPDTALTELKEAK